MPNQTCELSEISILILFHLPNCEVVQLQVVLLQAELMMFWLDDLPIIMKAF